MNGFEKHNLKHTSPSQINMWATSPDAWVARYLFNKSFSFGVAATVGTLTEDVVQEVLLGGEFGNALEKAKKEFHKRHALGLSEKDADRANDIEPMALNALEILKPYGEPEFVHKLNGVEQQKIELKCNGNGWELPIIGYLDFVYPEHGLIIDLKTTLRCPSVMSVEHQRQGAIYAQAKGNFGCKMLYVTPKKSNLLDVEDVPAVLKEIKVILNRQEKFLSLHDAATIKEIVPINAGSFYWTSDVKIREELYGY